MFCFSFPAIALSPQLCPSLLISLWLIASLIKPGIVGHTVSYGLLTLQLDSFILTHIRWQNFMDWIWFSVSKINCLPTDSWRCFSSSPVDIITDRQWVFARTELTARKLYNMILNVFLDACFCDEWAWKECMSLSLLSFSSNAQPSQHSPDILAVVFIYRPSPCTYHMTLGETFAC